MSDRYGAVKHGLANLSPRMQALQAEWKKLSIGFQRLANMKYEMELEMTEVKKIPLGVSGKRAPVKQLTIEEMIDRMSPEEMAEFMKKLEAKIS